MAVQKKAVPKGYLRTKIGILPEVWNVMDMRDVALKITDGTHDTPKTVNDGIPFITAIHVKDGYIDYKNCYYVTKEDHKKIYSRCNPQNGDLAIVNIGAGTASAAMINIDYEFSMKNVALIKPNRSILNPKYLELYQLYNKSNIFNKMMSGGAQPFLSLKEIGKLKVAVPPLSEQQKIATILSTWDKAIDLKGQLIQEKKKQKKGLMKKLLTAEVRLPGFEGAIDKKKLKKYIKESKERNRKGDETVVLSVTNKQGFILQEDQFDRVVASKDLSNYKIVRKNQFAYNPSRINVGSIDLLKAFDVGLLSPMYVVFECEDKLKTEYLYQFLKSEMFINMVPNLLQGSVRDSLSFDSLQTIEVLIPSVKEQTAIINVLEVADSEIGLLVKELSILKLQKKGFMQLLLTGIIRVQC